MQCLTKISLAEGEIAKPIDGWKYYIITNFGRVFSTYFHKENAYRIDSHGSVITRLKGRLTDGGQEVKNFRLDCLVASAFLPPKPAECPSIPKHINRNWGDCRAENLEWNREVQRIPGFTNYYYSEGEVYCLKEGVGFTGYKPCTKSVYHGTTFVALTGDDCFRRGIQINSIRKAVETGVGDPRWTQPIRKVLRERGEWKSVSKKALAVHHNWEILTDTQLDDLVKSYNQSHLETQLDEIFYNTKDILNPDGYSHDLYSHLMQAWLDEISNPVTTDFRKRLTERVKNKAGYREKSNNLFWMVSLDANTEDEEGELNKFETIEDHFDSPTDNAVINDLLSITEASDDLLDSLRDYAAGRISLEELQEVEGATAWFQRARENLTSDELEVVIENWKKTDDLKYLDEIFKRCRLLLSSVAEKYSPYQNEVFNYVLAVWTKELSGSSVRFYQRLKETIHQEDLNGNLKKASMTPFVDIIEIDDNARRYSQWFNSTIGIYRKEFIHRYAVVAIQDSTDLECRSHR